MSRNYAINNIFIRGLIREGRTQHVALVFPGTPFDIIGDEYVAADNGFILNEYYNQDEDITPGNVKSYVFSSTLLNHDSSLSGFDFARDFMLMVGVEADAGTNVSSYFGSGNTDKVERLLLNNVRVLLKNESVTFNYSSGSSFDSLPNCRHMFAIKGLESDATYYLFIVYDNGSSKYIGDTYKIAPGSGEASQVTTVRTTQIPINSCLFARLESLAANGICEVWSFNTNNTVCQQFVYDGATTVQHDILYEHMCVLTGKQPRKTLGKVITFEAVGLSEKLNQNADSYADTVFSSSRTIKTIRNNLLTAAGLTAGTTSYAPESSISFAENPFAGMHGYTYRDFLSQIGQSMGRSLREQYRRVSTLTDNNIPTGINITCAWFFPNVLFTTVTYNTLNKTDYYSYDADEYSVDAVNVVLSKQTDADMGVQYPDDPTGSNAFIVVNNQLLNDSDTSIVKARLSYLYVSLTNNDYRTYRPITVDMPSFLYLEPGDVMQITLEDNTSVKFPIFCMTTTWNGSADCTIECTGNKIRNQYEQKEFTKTLKEGNKIHELYVDINRVYSQIMDTLTNDYSTASQTAEEIALYVGNHAYEIVSGISITSAGVNISGSKFIQLSSSGYIGCGNDWIIDNNGLCFRGQTYTQNSVSYTPILRFGDNTDLYSTTVQRDKDGNQIVAGIGLVNETGYDEVLSRTVRLNSMLLGVTTPAWADTYASVGLKLRAVPSTRHIEIMPYAHDAGNNGWYTDLGLYDKPFSNIYGSSITARTSVSSPQYITTSSRDVKHDITPLPDMGALIDKLRPVSFVYNDDEAERKHLGLIHEDTVSVIPEVCIGSELADAKDKAINYVEFIPILLKEIQSLRQRVKELETQNVQN